MFLLLCISSTMAKGDLLGEFEMYVLAALAQLGDAEEEFAVVAARHGARRARRWYWTQTLASAWPLLARRSTAPNDSPPADPMWRTTLADARYALRLARRAPLAALAVIATMV